jgi:hypothetical protein
MKHTIAGAAAAGLAAITLAAAPIATAGPEEDFLIAIAAAGISSGSPDQAIALARSVCTDQVTGTAFNQVVQNLASSRGWSAAQAGAFASAATAAFCPQIS